MAVKDGSGKGRIGRDWIGAEWLDADAERFGVANLCLPGNRQEA